MPLAVIEVSALNPNTPLPRRSARAARPRTSTAQCGFPVCFGLFVRSFGNRQLGVRIFAKREGRPKQEEVNGNVKTCFRVLGMCHPVHLLRIIEAQPVSFIIP